MIAIIGAMQKEVEAILNLCSHPLQVMDEPIDVYRCRFGKADLLVCQSGIGKSEAAMTTAILLSRFDISLVINIGSAGGLQPGQKIGDVVIASELTYHDLIFDYLQPDEGLEKYHFKVDEKLVSLMQKSLLDLKIRSWIGQVVTGDQFVTNQKQVVAVVERFPSAICLEMEATAIAHVCHKFDVSFIIIRSLSDIAINLNNQVDFDKYLPLAAKSSANACMLFLTKYSQL